MFLREVRRRNKNGTQVSYLQLVHNKWDAAAQASRTKILYSFGRTDQVDPATIQRLIASLSRLLDPAAALQMTASSELTFLESRALGGTHVLDGMWPLAAELNRLQLITFTGPDGTFRQRTELTKPQRDIYTALQLDPPSKIIELVTPSS
jgi:lipopolysaccharide biosynthesis protein